ncbi:MAG: c-type cytochrome [Bacteroidetes bacterium]|nr:c-type cytochrome [Bacteroidota bacterium]
MKKWIVILFLVMALGAISSFRSEPKMTMEKLGEKLFFDPILSEDQTISCASCHKPEFAFADTTSVSKGVKERLGFRNTPSAMNVADRKYLFWDGRAASLEMQALFPIQDHNEMSLPIGIAVVRLNQSKKYRAWFVSVFKQAPNKHNLAKALAAFERTLETANTPNDRWMNDDSTAMTMQEIRGRMVFREKGKCVECHFSPDFTGDEFRSIGLFDGIKHRDSGRYLITHDLNDLGKFKVPGLRNVAITAPYMHDGSMRTLREVIDYYDNPQAALPSGKNRDSLLSKPLGLSEQEKQDLESFLLTLTDDRFVKKSTSSSRQ